MYVHIHVYLYIIFLYFFSSFLLFASSLLSLQACRDIHCINLSPQYISEKKYIGVFHGDPYVTWDVKVGMAELINSL